MSEDDAVSVDEVLENVENLFKDLKRNNELASMQSIPVDVRTYNHNTLWPFMEAVLDQVKLLAQHGKETDDAISELIEQSEDFLHAETAKEIGKPLGLALVIANELEKRLRPEDQKLRAMLAELRASAQTALATLREISINDDEDAGGGEEGEAPAGADDEDDDGEEGEEEDDEEGDDE